MAEVVSQSLQHLTKEDARSMAVYLKSLPETQSQLILTDPHSPGIHRTHGAIVNMDAWYDAFNVKPGDKLYIAPEKRIRIW